MALNANATKISLSVSKIPDGSTITGGVNLSNATPNYLNLRINTVKSVVDETVKSDAFDALRVDIEAQVAARLAADDIGTVKTANYNIDWLDVRNNQAFSEEFYSDVVDTYISTVNVYIVLS